MENMIRWIPFIRTITKYIDVVVNMDDYKQDETIAATNHSAIIFQPPIKKKYNMSDEAFVLYTHFISAVFQIIDSRNLNVVKHYPSKEFNDYYIQVNHRGHIDKDTVRYKIIFRIRNHINDTLDRGPDLQKPGQLVTPSIKDMILGKCPPDIYVKVMIRINHICDGIKNDNLEILNTDFGIFE